jgi:hypothetical protein
VCMYVCMNVYVCMYGTFNGSVRNSDSIASNVRMNRSESLWKEAAVFSFKGLSMVIFVGTEEI